MKTAMKRLLSFVLVAMMLVSVLPFQASAAGNTVTFDFKEGTDIVFTPTNNVFTWDLLSDSQKALLNASTWYKADGSKWTGEPIDVTAGSVVIQNWEPVDTWTITFTGAKTGTVEVEFDPGDSEKSSELEDAIADFLGEDAAGMEAGALTKTGDSAYTCAISKKTFNVTVSVAGANGTTVYPVQYKNSLTLDTAKINALYTFNSMEEVPGTWAVTGTTVNETVANGSAIRVTEHVNAVMTMVPTGYNKIELLNADGTHFGWAYEHNNRIVSCPEPENYGDQQFLEWTPYNNTGASIEEGKNMAGLTIYDQYIAKWKTNVNNGRSNLKVVAVYYADDHEKDRATVFTREMDNTATSILTGVLGVAHDQIKAEIEAQAPDYFGEVSWDGNYYNSSFSTKYTDTSLTLNGDKTIYVKINANDSAKAKVLLYVYKKVKETPDQILEMKGYLPHDDITLNDAITVAKKADWRASSYKMYNDREWKQLLNVTNATVYTTEEIEAGEGTTVVHLLLSNGYKTGGNADTSNPKTGDTILMAGGVLGLSAAALAVLYFLNKKKQVI